MATEQTTTEKLNEISVRLSGRATSLKAVCDESTADLRLAARTIDRYADLRFRVAEIAEQALAHPEWDRGAFARDLREALDQASGGGDLPEVGRSSHYS